MDPEGPLLHRRLPGGRLVGWGEFFFYDYYHYYRNSTFFSLRFPITTALTYQLLLDTICKYRYDYRTRVPSFDHNYSCAFNYS